MVHKEVRLCIYYLVHIKLKQVGLGEIAGCRMNGWIVLDSGSTEHLSSRHIQGAVATSVISAREREHCLFVVNFSICDELRPPITCARLVRDSNIFDVA